LGDAREAGKPDYEVMDSVSFHKLRTAVQENSHPAGDRAAGGLQRTLQVALSASGLFDEVELGCTDDVDQLIIGVCRCSAEILPWEAGLGVERLWRTVSSGVEWEAHHVGCTDSLMEFEGAVTVDGSGHYLTVHLVAEPAQQVASASGEDSSTTDASTLSGVATP
jgi:hypothetical protein